MKKKFLLYSTLALVISFIFSCSTRPRVLTELPSPVAASPVSPETWHLPNGLTVFFVQDPELPLVQGTLYMKGGELWEPEGMKGVVAAMGGQMRSGGAGKLSADALDRKLETMSASIGSSFDDEYGSVSFSALAVDFKEVFNIFSDVVQRPLFEEKRLSLWKGQRIESIRRRKDDPGKVAGIAYRQVVFGETPYGRVLVEKDVKNIDRLDLLKMHRTFVRPNQAILSVSGDIDRKELEQIIREKFGDWERRKSDIGNAPKFDYKFKPAIYFIEMPVEQSTLYFGHQGPERLSPDYIAIEGFNTAFGGGGFSSRLMKRVRTELGLAYSTYGAIRPGVETGRNIIFVQTKAHTTAEALYESLNVLGGLQEGLISEDELLNMKRHTQTSFVFRFDSLGKVVTRQALLSLLDYPSDYDSTYLDKVAALTAEEVRGVARQRWNMEQMAVIVVGNKTAYTSLETLMKDPPAVLKDYSIVRASFDQKFQL